MTSKRKMQASAPRNTQHATGSSCRGFTMIEIALSLAIIGFALVAIIGVLPIGMNTQKANREETVINQDFTVWMNAIRNGAKGLDELTNYVMAITNTAILYVGGVPSLTNVYVYTYYDSTVNGTAMSPPFPINNGLRIVGLLSTPKYLGNWADGNYIGNSVVASVRSMSGPASEKFPQDNTAVLDLGFNYRMTSEVVPYSTNYVDPSWVDYTRPGLTTDEVIARSNYWRVARTMQANLHDVRLLFRWPLRSGGQLGLGGQSFRTLVGGWLQQTNEVDFPRPVADEPSPYDLYFLNPHSYVTNAP
jgi:prepilin-type N-terminal cleavage/methylation domain-containing protein